MLDVTVKIICDLYLKINVGNNFQFIEWMLNTETFTVVGLNKVIQ
jgi:hypothetical protein